jgi:hypothetical protein
LAGAANIHLERIIAGERARAVRRMAILRLCAGAAGVLMAFGYGVLGGDEGFRGQLLPSVVYLAIAVALVAWGRWHPKGSRLMGLSVALVDVPLVTLINYAGLNARDPRFILGGIGLFGAVVTGAALTLSRAVVACTCVASLIGGALIYLSLDAPASEHVVIAVAPILSAGFCFFLVSRLQRLVEESRRDDLLGKYILGERLGTGGMAEVFRATYAPEGGFERQVAVKRVLPAYAADAAFIERFRREAELTAQLVHPTSCRCSTSAAIARRTFSRWSSSTACR